MAADINAEDSLGRTYLDVARGQVKDQVAKAKAVENSHRRVYKTGTGDSSGLLVLQNDPGLV